MRSEGFVFMRKRGFLPTGLFLFLWAGLLVRAPLGFPGEEPGQGQPERPKFYAQRVVSEKKVQNANDSLAAPDGRYAEILPGGELVLSMEKKIYPFTTLDSGTVVGQGEADYGLEGWLPIQDALGKRGYGWIPLAVGESPGGFRFSPVEPYAGSPGLDMIRIINGGTKSLFVDAVIGYAVRAERRLQALVGSSSTLH